MRDSDLFSSLQVLQGTLGSQLPCIITHPGVDYLVMCLLLCCPLPAISNPSFICLQETLINLIGLSRLTSVELHSSMLLFLCLWSVDVLVFVSYRGLTTQIMNKKEKLWLFTISIIAYRENHKEFIYQHKTPSQNLSYELGKAHNARLIYWIVSSIANGIKYTNGIKYSIYT